MAAGSLENRRRDGVGLDFLRPGARSHLLWDFQPEPVEPREASRGKLLDRGNIRAPPGQRQGALVLSMVAARTLGSLGRQRERDARCDLAGAAPQGGRSPGSQRV